jgi:multidrug efflux pump subunit AcrA (membrane-fusion protein)
MPRQAALLFAVRALVGGAVLAAAAGIAVALVSSRPMPEERAAGDDAKRVAVVTSFDAPIGRRWRGYGTVASLSSADVPARVEATIVALGPRYRAGERVARGDLLLQLDDSDFLRQLQMAEQAIAVLDAQLELLVVEEETTRDALRIAEDQLALAEADLVRAEDALAAGAAVEREVDGFRQSVLAAKRAVLLAREAARKVPSRRLALEAERASQQNARDLARTSLERCRITSPIDGIVQLAELRVGEIVRPGDRIARVVDPRFLEVQLVFPSTARESIAIGDRVVVTPERARSEPVELTIDRIAPEDDVATRTVRAFAEISIEGDPSAPRMTPVEGQAASGAAPALAPGVFVAAEVETAADRLRTLVPRRALNEGRIRVVRDGRVQSLQVTVDFHVTGVPPDAPVADTEWAVLRESLPPGTQIVLDGSRQLREGSAVVAVVAQRGDAAVLARPIVTPAGVVK